ncbi:hypothetical protein [Gorillibacterium sp. CAU 1737]|uniref:hypothetical protein n=1 Tax=Gorillibacterium sp. CAU 1737 TaxID=3140362 RepID=UPI0032606D1B
MGLDYRFVTVIPNEHRERMYEYIKNNGALFDSGCTVIHFPMDSFILKYLEGGYDWKPHYDQEEIEKHIEPDGKASIGCIYIKEREQPGGELEVSLTAATTDMSLLFRDSFSISKWFVQMSIELNSILTYLDKEDDGVRILFYQGAPVQLDLSSDTHLGNLRDRFLPLVQDFARRYEHFEDR